MRSTVSKRDRVEPRPRLQQRQLQQFAGELRERAGQLTLQLLRAAATRRRRARRFAPKRLRVACDSSARSRFSATARSSRFSTLKQIAGDLHLAGVFPLGQPFELARGARESPLPAAAKSSWALASCSCDAAEISAAFAGNFRQLLRRQFDSRFSSLNKSSSPASGSSSSASAAATTSVPSRSVLSRLGHFRLQQRQMRIEQIEVIKQRIGHHADSRSGGRPNCTLKLSRLV